MRTPTATLPELVEALHDGMGYLYLAAERSHHPARVQLFHRIRRLKADIAADLASGCVGPMHPVPEDGSWLAAWRQACSGLPATLAHGPDRAMLKALDAQELRLLRAFRDAIGKDQPPTLRELAATHLPEVEEACDELHELKSTSGHPVQVRKRPPATSPPAWCLGIPHRALHPGPEPGTGNPRPRPPRRGGINHPRRT